MADNIKQQMQARAQRRAGLTLERLRSQAAQMETRGDTVAVEIGLDAITVDEAIQVRVAGLSDEKVQQYAVIFEEGGEFPPVIVFRDERTDALFLADGFHRVEAAKLAGLEAIKAEVRPGGFEAAMEYAEEANLEHGFALSARDKKHILERRIARGHEWASWSDRQISRVLGVAHTTVGRWRSEIESKLRASGANAPVSTERVGADGRIYDVSNVQEANRRRAEEARKYQAYISGLREAVADVLKVNGGTATYDHIVARVVQSTGASAGEVDEAVREMARLGDAEISNTQPMRVSLASRAPRVRYVDGGEFNQDTSDEAVYGVPVVEGEANADKAWTAFVEMYRGWIEEFLRGRSASYKELYEAIVGQNTEQDQHFAFDAALKALDTGGVVVCNGGYYVLAEEQQGKHPAETIPGYQQMVEAHFGDKTPPAPPSAGLYSAQRLERLLGHVNGAIYKLVEHVRDMEKQGHGVPDEMRERVLAVMRGAEQRAYDGEWLPYAFGAIEQMLGIRESDGE